MKTNILFAAILLLFSIGCATVSRTNEFHGRKTEPNVIPMETVEISNSCWLIFKYIPIASGDPAFPNFNTCKFFTNTVTLQNNLVMLDNEAKRVGADGRLNVTSFFTDENFLFILLSRRSYHTSAVLFKEKTK